MRGIAQVVRRGMVQHGAMASAVGEMGHVTKHECVGERRRSIRPATQGVAVGRLSVEVVEAVRTIFVEAGEGRGHGVAVERRGSPKKLVAGACSNDTLLYKTTVSVELRT